MRTILDAAGVAATTAIAILLLAGCGGASAKEDQGPGNGPIANEPVPPSATIPVEAGAGEAPIAPAASEPARSVIARGDFVNKSELGSGSALLLAGADNMPFLRLENIVVSAGPALHVLLTKEASPSSKGDVDKGSLDLGPLRATQGNLTYTIPANTDVSSFGGVVVYCVEYDVVFTAAPLTR